MNTFQVLIMFGFAATLCLADNHKNETVCPDESECRESSGVKASDIAISVVGDTFGHNVTGPCMRLQAYFDCMESDFDDCKVGGFITKATEILDNTCNVDSATSVVVSSILMVASLLLSRIAPNL